MARVFVITGPSGVGKGTLIRGLMRARAPSSSCRVSATTRAPRPGERDGVDYHFLTRRGVRPPRRARASSSSTPTTPAAATGRCAPSSSAASRAGVPVVLEIEVQGARQVRAAMPEARAGLHRAAVAATRCARASSAAAPTTPRRSSAACASPSRSSRPSDEFAHVVVNDRLEDAARASSTAIVARGARRLPADAAGARPRTRLEADRERYPQNDLSPHRPLLENVDSNYASVLVAAKRARQINSYYHNLGEGTFDEFPPPMVETGSKNYLTIALEEVAAGKIKYHYR